MKTSVVCCCLALLMSGHTVVFAKDYCQPMPKAVKEGDPWYIPESAFTKEAANKSLKNLSDQVNKGVEGQDFLIETDLKMVKGYLYRLYIAQYEKDFGKIDADFRKEFCKFLSEAYVSH